ncbi:transmembrane protein 176B-like isoform 2-T3 [Mantella aurantiaca]
MVAVSTVKTEEGKVSCETPDGTVINININQRSCMDSIVDAIKNVRMVKKDGQYNQPAKEPVSGVHLGAGVHIGAGVSFMSLGFISVMLAIIIDVVRPDLYIRYSGTHYWVGFPCLVAGVLNVVTYKYPKAFWVVISYISLLGCLAVSIAGAVFAGNDLNANSWRWRDMQYLCDSLRRNQYDYGYGYRTAAPRYDSYNRDYDLERCKNGFQDYQKLLQGLVIMSLLMMIWGICVSALSLIYRTKVFFSACKCEKVEEDKDDDLLSANPVQDIIIA